MGNIDKDRIVCRCKKVSEGTVIEAIKNGADTYEKVKKETGANTYGCFACRLEIKKLLEENKKENEEEAEKREEIVMNSAEAAYRDIVNGEKSTGFGEVVEVFNNNIHPITPIELERLQDWKDRNKDKLSDTKFEGANAQAYVYVE